MTDTDFDDRGNEHLQLALTITERVVNGRTETVGALIPGDRDGLIRLVLGFTALMSELVQSVPDATANDVIDQLRMTALRVTTDGEL